MKCLFFPSLSFIFLFDMHYAYNETCRNPWWYKKEVGDTLCLFNHFISHLSSHNESVCTDRWLWIILNKRIYVSNYIGLYSFFRELLKIIKYNLWLGMVMIMMLFLIIAFIYYYKYHKQDKFYIFCSCITIALQKNKVVRRWMMWKTTVSFNPGSTSTYPLYIYIYIKVWSCYRRYKYYHLQFQVHVPWLIMWRKKDVVFCLYLHYCSTTFIVLLLVISWLSFWAAFIIIRAAGCE